MTGYQAAITDGADVLVKLDGDGQMDPSLIPDFILPIIHGFDDIRGNLYWTDPALDEPVPFGPLRFGDFN